MSLSIRTVVIVLLIGSAAVGLLGWVRYHAPAAPDAALSRSLPAGAVLFLQAEDFSALLTDWNGSPQRRAWLGSTNYEVFSRSRLLLRLQDAAKQFSAAAGLPPDMKLLSELAGNDSVFALYDIGKLQFVYITRQPSTGAVQNQLWQTRSKFETRDAGGVTFYLRRDPESQREVEFAVKDDYLLLATREDLMANALELMAGGKGESIEAEPWFAQAVTSAGTAGDLRMVLNLKKIVPTPYFRSYWVQQNISDMKLYSAAVTDLFRSGAEYREERVLLKNPGGSESASGDDQAVSDLVRLPPAGAGFYQAQACLSFDPCLDLLETKLLSPHSGPAPAAQAAPSMPSAAGDAGSSSDLETRIDQPPAQRAADIDGSAALKAVMHRAQVEAALQVQSTERDQAGVFVRIHTAIVLAGQSEWDQSLVLGALTNFIRPTLTASRLGVTWKQNDGYFELDGLQPLRVAVKGKYLMISDDAKLLEGMLVNVNRKSDLKPAVFVAEVSYRGERENFVRLVTVVDRPDLNIGMTQPGRLPQFLSENVASLSATLAAVSSEKIVVRDAGDKVLQTVTYQWSQ